MSRKTFCDACGSEILRNHTAYTFEYQVHLNDMIDGRIDRAYVDRDGNRTSGRKESVDLCVSCYNGIVIEAVKSLRKEQEFNGKSSTNEAPDSEHRSDEP